MESLQQDFVVYDVFVVHTPENLLHLEMSQAV